MIEEKWCIYCHLNKINGKRYIGQTKTKLITRFGKNGIRYKGVPLFYNAIKKYGWNNFEHLILEDNISTQEIANEKEKYYILLYKSTNNNFGYNIQNGGYEQNKLSKKVYQYSLDGEYIRLYKSISEANRKLFISNGKISDCCRKIKKSAGGYIWSYEKFDCIEKYIRKTKSLPVYQYSLSGKFIKSYKTLIDAVKEMNLANGSHISSCCNGKRRTAYGFMWSYEKFDKLYSFKNKHNQNVTVIQFDLNKNKICSFKNLMDASKQFGEKSEKAYYAINRCLNKKSKSAYGFYWEYKI